MPHSKHVALFSILMILADFSEFVSAAPPVDFQRQVQPILAEHCTLCHGVDTDVRKAGLRLDVRVNALAGGESGNAAIVPGQPDDSEMMRRITSHDADTMMPPKDHNKPLSEVQIATLRQWITEGAKYENHWAFTAPTKSVFPHSEDRIPMLREFSKG